MAKPIDKITLKGFKSIKALEDFELRKLNVLIGANGAGKSNFVDFFRMLRAVANRSIPAICLGSRRWRRISLSWPKGDEANHVTG